MLSPALFLALLETALALSGFTVPRYEGFGDPGRYWIAWQVEGQPAGFSRALPRAWRQRPEPLPVFLADKPANGYRVFVLGESSVKGDPYETGSFTDWLRLRLTAMLPSRSVEVVNAGNSGWHATDVRLLLQECLSHRPDLLIWMVGHNEFVPHNVLTLRAELLAPLSHAVSGWFWRSRTVNWLSERLPSLSRHRALACQPADGEPVFGPERPLLEQRFRQATAGAVADARAAGVPIVLCTLPRNVREWPPAISTYSDSLRRDPARKAQWDEAYARGSAALEQGDGASALAELAPAVALDPTPAKLQFARGRAFEALGMDPPARACFLLALTLDGGPMRAQDWVERAIRDVAAETGAPLVDLQPLFDDAGQLGLAGLELLCDNCHPNFAGHELIASEILRVLERELGLPLDRSLDIAPEAGRDALGIPAYQAHQARQAEALNLVRLSLQHFTVNETWDQAHSACLAVLETDPGDAEVGGGLGLLEALAGNAEEARALIEKAMAGDPTVQTSYVYLWQSQPPYERAFAAAGVDMAAVEASLNSEQRRALDERMHRAASR